MAGVHTAGEFVSYYLPWHLHSSPRSCCHLHSLTCMSVCRNLHQTPHMVSQYCVAGRRKLLKWRGIDFFSSRSKHSPQIDPSTFLFMLCNHSASSILRGWQQLLMLLLWGRRQWNARAVVLCAGLFWGAGGEVGKGWHDGGEWQKSGKICTYM